MLRKPQPVSQGTRGLATKARRRAIGASIVLLGLLCAGGSALAKDGARPASQNAGLFGQDVVPGEVIVRYKPGASSSDRAGAMNAADASHVRDLLLSRTELVKVEPGQEDEAAAKLERDPDVAYAEPNGIAHAAITPNDTRFGQLWGLNNTGQAVNGVTGVADADIDAPEAWNMGAGLGASVRVAVVDSGVQVAHPDLAQNRFLNPGESGGGKETNGIDDDGNGKVDDFRGWDFVNNDNNPVDDNEHGTHVAGTIAGRANNSLGVAGAASFPTTSGNWQGPKIIAVKVLNAAGSGSFANIADGLVYAGTMSAKVANVSLGGGGTSATLDNAIKSRPNTLYAIAAGNGGADGVGDNNDTVPQTPCNPASTPDAANKICVAATDSSDQLAGFSNFGVTNVDIAAPGVTILSTVPQNTIFTENFEVPITGRWINNDTGQTGTPRWNRTTLFSTSPNNSVTDSPGGTAAAPTQYVNNQFNWIRNATGFNLTGGTNCSLKAQGKIDTESGFDFFRVQSTRTPSNAASWQTMFSFSGGPAQGSITAPFPAAFNGQNGVFVRLLLDSDGSVTDDGAYIDDVSVKCFAAAPNSTAFAFFNGTSMATPHVAGAAAFLFTKFPTATVAQIKDKILRSGDAKADLAGKVATGDRLNMYKAAAESSARVTGGVLTFTPGVGQRNAVTVTRFNDTDGIAKYRIADAYSTSTAAQQSGSRITPVAGCTRVNDFTVKCPVAGITRINVLGSDQNDTLNASTIAIPVTLNGGSGADTLTGGTAGDSLIGSTGIDRFTSGAGNDTISARNNDADGLFLCGENGGDTDTVTADSTPNDPITASATNCEVVNKA
jgi:subtilisin family serine protease